VVFKPYAEQAIDAGPIKHMGEFLGSARQVQRLLIIILGEKAFWRHWRQDIGQGHAHGALYQRKRGLREGPGVDAARGIGR
jgi:hypothetical protein